MSFASILGKLIGSKTVIGTLIATVPALAVPLGFTFGADDAAMVTGSVDLIIQLAGALFAMWGRWVAKGPLAD